MCRSLVNVESRPSGWQVSIKGTPIMTHADELEALTAAADFARARYDATGEPTGVGMRMPCGDTVILAAHGWVHRATMDPSRALPNAPRTNAMLSKQDSVDLACLASVERIGDPSDGCDPTRYTRLGLIQKSERFWTLTGEGRERLADLRALAGEDPSFEPTSKASTV